MSNSRFRWAYERLLPSWLTSGDGGKVLYSLGAAKDAFCDRVYYSLLARFPQHAPADSLAYHSRDRKIVRGINETAESFSARLVRWLDDHYTRGNPYALMQQLQAYCNAAVRIRTVDRRGNWYTLDSDGTKHVTLAAGNWDWDDGGLDRWARFWVIIYPTSGGLPWSASVPGAWPSGGTIGTSATLDEVASVRGIIRDWKPAGTKCEWVIIAYDAASFDPTAPEPDGTWQYYGTNNAGHYELARLTTARYWSGS